MSKELTRMLTSKESDNGKIVIKRDITRGRGMGRYSKPTNRYVSKNVSKNGIIKEIDKERPPTLTPRPPRWMGSIPSMSACSAWWMQPVPRAHLPQRVA